MSEDGVKRQMVTCRLPETLVSAVKAACEGEGCTLTDFIERALRRVLDGVGVVGDDSCNTSDRVAEADVDPTVATDEVGSIFDAARGVE